MKHVKLILALVFGLVALLAGTFAIAAWTGGNTVGLMYPAEQVSILKVVLNSSNSATITISNQGGQTVKFNSAYINDQTAALDVCEVPSGLPKGYSANLFVTLQNGSQFISGAEYDFMILTAKGSMIIYSVTYEPAAVVLVPSHVHSINPILVPDSGEAGYKSLVGLSWEQTSALVWSIAAAIYVSISVILVLINRKIKVPKEISLLCLVDGSIFLLLPLFWLYGISFSTLWAQAVMFLSLGLLGYSVYHVSRLKKVGRRDRAGTFILFLVITVLLSFIVVFWATYEPPTFYL